MGEFNRDVRMSEFDKLPLGDCVGLERPEKYFPSSSSVVSSLSETDPDGPIDDSIY